MAGATKGAASIIRSQYPKAIYFHCASHKLNLCVASSCKLSCVNTMMSHTVILEILESKYFKFKIFNGI